MKSNIFAILSKCITKNIYDKYTYQGELETVFISDTSPEFTSRNVYTYDDIVLEHAGFHHAGFGRNKPTAWDKIFWHLKHAEQSYDFVWIIEDDCYLNKKKFPSLVEQYIDESADILHFSWVQSRSVASSSPGRDSNWSHFRNVYNKYFPVESQSGSLNVFTRLSVNLVNKVLEFQQKHSRFVFHEIMIPTVAEINKLTRKQIVNKEIICYAKSLPSKVVAARDKYTVLHPMKEWCD